MSQNQEVIYDILIWAVPVLLALLTFIGSLSVNALIKMGKDIGEIKVTAERISTKHDGLEKRVEGIERHIDDMNKKLYK